MTPQEKESMLLDSAKRAIGYERHVDLTGKEKADAVLWHWIQGAKSEAAREYHQQEPKEVDVFTDEQIAYHFKRLNCFGHYLEGLINGSKWMRDTLKPHLQPKQESDAVEFADWLKDNKYRRGDDWYHGVDRTKTTSDLYAEFKQSKTNSGNKNEQEIKN